MEQQLKLTRIAVDLKTYGPNKGEYEGGVTYEGAHGTVTVNLDNRLSIEVLKVIADSMTRATRELANNLTAQVFEQASTNLLQAPADERSESPSDQAGPTYPPHKHDFLNGRCIVCHTWEDDIPF